MSTTSERLPVDGTVIIGEPEDSMRGFVARVGPVPAVTRPSERARSFYLEEPPPFGSWRGNRVAYSVNLPAALSARLDAHVAGLPVRRSLGAVAVDAIRTCWDDLARELDPHGDDPRFPRQRPEVGLLPTDGAIRRRVLYVTAEEADGIAAVRAQLYGIELGQLHRACLDRYLG